MDVMRCGRCLKISNLGAESTSGDSWFQMFDELEKKEEM